MLLLKDYTKVYISTENNPAREEKEKKLIFERIARR
jgi:hypothetical protein